MRFLGVKYNRLYNLGVSKDVSSSNFVSVRLGEFSEKRQQKCGKICRQIVRGFV